MKQKRLQILFISLFLCIISIQAQQPHPLKTGPGSAIPPGNNRPQVAFKAAFSTEAPAEIRYRERGPGWPFFGIDTTNKKFLFSDPQEKPTNLRLIESAEFTLNRQGKKDRKLMSDFEITKDINEISDSYPSNYRYNSGSFSFAKNHGVSYFSAEDGIHGTELWRSDGTKKGTFLFKDLNPGEAASGPGEIISVNNKIFFSATDNASGREVWMSDGTSAGTKMVADVNPGPEGSNPSQMVSVGNSVFFVTSPGRNYHYAQLWKTEGSSESTVLLLDFLNTFNNFFISQTTSINNLLFFVVRSYSINGPAIALWRSDGTKEGTFQVKSFADWFAGVMHLTQYNNRLYFSADDGTGRKLWTSDGTVSGTYAAPGNNGVNLTWYYYSSSATPFQQIGNSLMILGANAEGGGLFKYDASTNYGIQLVKILALPGDNTSVYQTDIGLLDGTVYFKISKYHSYQQYDEMWRSDGTTANTKLVKEFPPFYNTSSNNYYPHNGRLYFVREQLLLGYEPWISDGTTEGTKLLKDIFIGPESSHPSSYTSINGKLIFAARSQNGSDLWSTDGTETGTTVVKDINTRSTASSYAGTGLMVPLENVVIFSANDGEHGQEMFRSDGSSKGTFMLKDIYPPVPQYNSPYNLLAKKQFAYFLASRQDSSVQVTSIYKTDGSSKGTTIQAEVRNTYFDTYNITDDGIIYYGGYTWNGYIEGIWRTDGTMAGTYLLTNNYQRYSPIIAIGNRIYFPGKSSVAGNELWTSDGTIAGTRMIKDIYPGSQGSYPQSLFPFKNDIYFSAYDGIGYNTLWKSDGTETGTIKLSTAPPIGGIYAVSNGMLYFNGSDNSMPFQGWELWRTDGSSVGTKLVKNINPYADAFPTNLTDVNGVLFFLASDGVQNNNQLWKTDGTEAGTSMLTDEPAVSGWPNFNTLTAAGGRLFFLKRFLTGKNELWTSDGTAENTRPVADDLLDQMTFVNNIIGVQDRLFISGLTYRYGYELYSAEIKTKSKRSNDIELREIPEVITDKPFAVSLFPNPAKTISTLLFNYNVSNVTVSITDISGKLIWKKSYTNTRQVSLPMEILHSGLYSISINNRIETKTIKLVKR